MHVSFGFCVLLASLTAFGHLFLWQDDFSDGHAAALRQQVMSALQAHRAKTATSESVDTLGGMDEPAHGELTAAGALTSRGSGHQVMSR